MQDIKVTSHFSVAPQIALSDLAAAAQAGYKIIISNRPDGEELGQPSAEEVAGEAKAHGLAFYHIPVVGGQLTEEAVRETARLLEENEGPFLAFCRSGTRSITLWALAQAGEKEPEEVIRMGREAGYELDHLRPVLEALAVRT